MQAIKRALRLATEQDGRKTDARSHRACPSIFPFQWCSPSGLHALLMAIFIQFPRLKASFTLPFQIPRKLENGFRVRFGLIPTAAPAASTAATGVPSPTAAATSASAATGSATGGVHSSGHEGGAQIRHSEHGGHPSHGPPVGIWGVGGLPELEFAGKVRN